MTCREGDQRWRTCRPIAVPVGVQDGAGPSMHCWIIIFPMKNSHFWHVPFFRPSNLWQKMFTSINVGLQRLRGHQCNWGLLCQTRVRRSGVSSEARVPTVTLYLRVSVFFPQNIKVHPIATGWWFGTWLLFFIFFPSYWGHVIIPTDELTPSFFRGVGQPATWRCDEDDEDPALAPRLSKIKNRNTIYCSFKQHQMIWCSRYISLIHPIPKPFSSFLFGGLLHVFICFFWHFP